MAIARAQVAAAGPSALRLKEVAREAGVSHPTILHHFGNRDGLVTAVIKDTMASLHDELRAELARQRTLDPVPLIQALARVLTEGGFARLLAWLSLSRGKVPLSLLDAEPIITMIHHMRRRSRSKSEPEPTMEEATFAAILAVSAIVGEAIIGDGLRLDLGSAGQFDREAFHERLGEMFGRLLR